METILTGTPAASQRELPSPGFIAALTVIQPWAGLIALPDDHPDMKRVENREWYTRHRGPLAIHAGKSRARLNDFPRLPPDLRFGCVVAVVDVLDCLKATEILAGQHDDRFPWLKTHQHVEGTWCWVLGNVRALAEPIEYKGGQGLWRLPKSVLV